MDEAGAALFRKRLFLSMVIPGMLVVFLWLLYAVALASSFDAYRLGIFPLSLRGLPGIILSPLVHGSVKHLLSNSLPLFLLGTSLFYFYGDLSVKVFLLNWLLTGVMVWLAGREAWHIGASGLVYGLVFFLFFSGIIRRHFRLMALSLLIVFVYGSLVWGMFPVLSPEISWESHMLGAVSGIFLFVWYRDEGPQAPVKEWPEDCEEGGEMPGDEDCDLSDDDNPAGGKVHQDDEYPADGTVHQDDEYPVAGGKSASDDHPAGTP